MTPVRPEDEFISRKEANVLVERVSAATRREMTAAITTVQVQIGATERILGSKISSVRAWGLAALLGGQTLAAVAAAYIRPHVASTAFHALASHLPL